VAERAAAEATAILTGSERLRAIRELIAALGQQAKFADVERLVHLVRGRMPEVALGAAWVECLARAAGYLFPGGFYDATRSVLADIQANSNWVQPTAAARLGSIHGMEAWHEGNLARALVLYEGAAKEYESVSDARSAAEMQANIGALLGDLGRLEQAVDKLTAVLNAADRMRIYFLSAFASMNLCCLHAQLGRFAAARTAGDRAIELAHKQGDVRIAGFTRTYKALGSCLEGQFIEAEEHARAAIEILADIQPALPGALAALAQALLQQGKASEALIPAQEAYHRLETLGRVDDGEALIRLIYAECLLEAGRSEEGRRALGNALRRLDERAAAIRDPEWREEFLSRIPTHSRTIAMATRILRD
jgi:tetratricopeptide (TPR) repeat protein